MIQNVLAGVLSCYPHGFSIEDIKVAIETFIPSPSQTPEDQICLISINLMFYLIMPQPAGPRALHKYVEKLDGHPKIGIVAGVGDRRKQDNFELGQISAEKFDEIIIRTIEILEEKTNKN